MDVPEEVLEQLRTVQVRMRVAQRAQPEALLRAHARGTGAVAAGRLGACADVVIIITRCISNRQTRNTRHTTPRRRLWMM
jgi:hypothetical protein